MSVDIARPAEHVAELVLNRPEALNALSTAFAQELADAAVGIATDAAVSAVLLTSAVPRAFCVGADLKERRGFAEIDFRRQRVVFEAAFGALAGLPMPTIAVVEGFALGGGCELALACDLVVASEGATFGLPEVGLGLIPGAGGTQRLPRRIGPARAAELIFTGRRVDAAEATHIGLVDHCVGRDHAHAAAVELATSIARHSPRSLRAAKRAITGGLDVDLATGLGLERQAWEDAAFSADRVEGIEAFNAQRPPYWPSWKGQA